MLVDGKDYDMDVQIYCQRKPGWILGDAPPEREPRLFIPDADYRSLFSKINSGAARLLTELPLGSDSEIDHH